jgi:biopolymer transport protein ExbD
VPLKSIPLEEPSLNLTPMLDVVLNLIVFFMLSTQFKEAERQYDIELPTVADTSALTGQPDELIVNVHADGRILLGTDLKTVAELEAALTAARERFPGQAVVVRGDGRGYYQPVMDAMAAARRAGIRNLSLSHQPQKASP